MCYAQTDLVFMYVAFLSVRLDVQRHMEMYMFPVWRVDYRVNHRLICVKDWRKCL